VTQDVYPSVRLKLNKACQESFSVSCALMSRVFKSLLVLTSLIISMIFNNQRSNWWRNVSKLFLCFIVWYCSGLHSRHAFIPEDALGSLDHEKQRSLVSCGTFDAPGESLYIALTLPELHRSDGFSGKVAVIFSVLWINSDWGAQISSYSPDETWHDCAEITHTSHDWSDAFRVETQAELMHPLASVTG